MNARDAEKTTAPQHTEDSRVKLVALAALVGLLTGTATFVLSAMIDRVSDMFTGFMSGGTANWQLLYLPFAGIILSMVLQRYIIHEDVSNGTAIINRCFVNGQYRLNTSYMFMPIMACTVTLGFGGSAGAEGPSAYTGAAIGSNVARWFRLSDESMRILLACGAGAGIAGIFKAPIGGVLFTLEVLAVSLQTFPVILLLTSCLLSYSTAYIFGGMRFDVIFHQILPFDVHHMLWICILGVFCGVYSIWYRWLQEYVRNFLTAFDNPWVKALLGGSVLSMAVFLFPALYGEGYGIVSDFVSGDAFMLFTFGPFTADSQSPVVFMCCIGAILLLKGGMVSCTNCSGGVAGDFAPTIFAGCLAGYLLAMLANMMFDAGLSPENMALVGMSSVMAGVIRAPLMSIFIAVEMSNSFEFIAGFILASVISYAIVVFVTPGVRRLDTQLVERVKKW